MTVESTDVNNSMYILQLQNRPWEVAARDIEDTFRRLAMLLLQGAEGINVAKDGLTAGRFETLDFAGGIVSISADPLNLRITITFPGWGSPAGLGGANADGTSTNVPRADHVHKREVEVLKDSVLIGVRRKLNFLGTGVSVADNPGLDQIDITITGGGAAALTGAGPLIGLMMFGRRTIFLSQESELLSAMMLSE